MNRATVTLILTMYMVLMLTFTCAWPFGNDDDEERINKLSTRLSESVSKLKTADEDMWKQFLKFREIMSRDLEAITFKLNEVITEVNSLKIKLSWLS